jgi:uncharacterized membrane protein YhaH (DUF805 family)
MIKAILRGLKSLTVFSGRDNPSQFWPYAGFVLLLAFIGFGASALPEISRSMQAMQRFAVQHPELANVQSTPTSYSVQIDGYHPELMPDFTMIIRGLIVGIVLAVILLAAAVVRRLHDRGRSGLWGLLPLPFLGVACAMLPRLFSSFSATDGPPLPLFFGLVVNNFLYLAALAILAVTLAGQGADEANRFGAPP